MNLNVRAVFYLTREVAARMVKVKWGRVINIGSALGEHQSHAALVALTEDFAPAGFEAKTVNGIYLKAARFKTKDQRVDVYWSGFPAPLAGMVALQPGDHVRDMMGNPVPVHDAQLGEYPLYVLGKIAPSVVKKL